MGIARCNCGDSSSLLQESIPETHSEFVSLIPRAIPNFNRIESFRFFAVTPHAPAANPEGMINRDQCAGLMGLRHDLRDRCWISRLHAKVDQTIFRKAPG